MNEREFNKALGINHADEDIKPDLDGFFFVDLNGEESVIQMGKLGVNFYRPADDLSYIYYEDIPRFILALQECLKMHNDGKKLGGGNV